MKIVNLETFRALPEATIYCKYEPCIFGPIEVKGETWEFDFLCSDFINVDCQSSEDLQSILEKAEETGQSFDLTDDGYGRDGCFESGQLFAVLEYKDLLLLQSQITDALEVIS